MSEALKGAGASQDQPSAPKSIVSRLRALPSTISMLARGTDPGSAALEEQRAKTLLNAIAQEAKWHREHDKLSIEGRMEKPVLVGSSKVYDGRTFTITSVFNTDSALVHSYMIEWQDDGSVSLKCGTIEVPRDEILKDPGLHGLPEPSKADGK